MLFLFFSVCVVRKCLPLVFCCCFPLSVLCVSDTVMIISELLHAACVSRVTVLRSASETDLFRQVGMFKYHENTV